MRSSPNRFMAIAMTLLVLGLFTQAIPAPVAFGLLLCLGMAWGLLNAAMTMNVTRGDVYAKTGVYPSLYPVVVTADKAKDVGVDVRGFESVMFVGEAGAIAAAGLVKLVAQECATIDGVYTDVAAADLEGAFTDFAANTCQKVGYKGVMDFVALRADYTSGTSVLVGGQIVCANPRISNVA